MKWAIFERQIGPSAKQGWKRCVKWKIILECKHSQLSVRAAPVERGCNTSSHKWFGWAKFREDMNH